jgi:hypothetical protein
MQGTASDRCLAWQLASIFYHPNISAFKLIISPCASALSLVAPS